MSDNPTKKLVDFVSKLEQYDNRYESVALKKFRIGKFINTNNLVIDEDLCLLFNCRADTLREYAQVANALNNDDDKFKRQIKIYKNWKSLKERLIPSKRQKKPKTPTEIEEEINHLIDLAIKEGSQVASDVLERIGANISKYFPTKKTYDLIPFLRYYHCVVCYAPAPQEGHDLASHPEYPRLRFPLCDDCWEQAKMPNGLELAKMYSNYILLLEERINEIQEEGIAIL